MGLVPAGTGPGAGGEIRVFGYALDIWSLGCIVHELLTLQTPFSSSAAGATTVESGLTDATPASEVYMAVLYPYCQGMAAFPTVIMRTMDVDEEGIDFIQSLMAARPEKRATASQALRDPWLANTGYISHWHNNLLGECVDLGITLELHTAHDITLLRRIRATDIGSHFRSGGENLTELMGRALENGQYNVASVLMNSAARRSEDHSGKDWARMFERAVDGGHGRWVKLLLSGGGDVNAINSEGLTALQVAAAKGHTGVVETLLDHDAETTDPSTDKPQVLQIAIEKGCTEISKLLVANKADVHAWVGSRTALLTAINGRNIDIVQLLLDNGVDANAMGKEWALVEIPQDAGMVGQIYDLYGDNGGSPGSIRGRTVGQPCNCQRNKGIPASCSCC